MPVIQELLISISSNLVDEGWHSPLHFKHFRYCFLLFGENSLMLEKDQDMLCCYCFSILTLLSFRKYAA